jgi:hypothetical protein
LKSNSTQQKLAEIKERQDRVYGGEKLSVEERVTILNEIYDLSLLYWLECAVTKSSKGTFAVSGQIERARLEMDTWGGKGTKTHKVIIEWQPSNVEKDEGKIEA